MTDRPFEVTFPADRISDLLERLERMVAHDPAARLEISPAHDELDAIAFGINALADELRFAHSRITETERLKAEALREDALKRSSANFATAFHSNPCVMVIVRLGDGRFRDVNVSFERQTGFRRDEVVGRTVAEFGMWIDPDDLAAVVAAICAGGRLESREVRYRTRSGAFSTAVFSADVIEFGDERCVLAAGLDVTERKRTETQAALLREELAHLGRVTMLDALTGSLAHEINQPLTAIRANADAAVRLLEVKPPRWAAVGATLEDIRRDSQRAGDVVRRMRMLLRKTPTHHELLDLAGTVADVVKLAEGNAVGRRIRLDVELASNLLKVRGDRTQIQQVVLNLLLNAFDAVQDRPPVDRRVGLRLSGRNGAALIEVSDRGPELPDESLALLFEPFYSTKEEGLGLGLSICRTIVGAHGGTIEAARNAGPGMTFSVAFPLIAPEPGSPHDARQLQAQP
jgi:two-component system sensor kinase FixL